MSNISIVCANCGARYRLPETFKSARAKCKSCGSVIDVASQRSQGAAAQPAPAAKARPASKASVRASAAEETGTARSRRSRSSERGRDEGAASGRQRTRRGARAQKEPQGGNKGLLMGGIALVAVIIVVAIMMIGGPGEDAAREDTAGTPPVDQQPTANTNKAPVVAPVAQGKDTEQAADAGAGRDEDKPVDADANKADGQPGDPGTAAIDPEPKPGDQAKVPLAPGERWKKSSAITAADIFDPREELEEVPWFDYTADAQKLQIEEFLDAIEHGGRPGIRAKSTLEKMGHVAIPGIINRLRKVDYTDSFDVMFAFELNKMLESMTIGMNVGFVTVDIGDDIPVKKADWNARTVKAWHALPTKYPTVEDFKHLVSSRKKRNKINLGR